MKKLVMSCAVAGLIALSAKSEAKSSASTPSASLPAVESPAAIASSSVPGAPEENAEVGVASWYGEQFQGSETASGEIFDLNGLTAAHLTLPFGTTVRVTNLKNNKNIRLKINDRGPFIARRLIDVSWAAAKRLGFVGEGTTPVRVEVVSYPKSFQASSLAKAVY